MTDIAMIALGSVLTLALLWFVTRRVGFLAQPADAYDGQEPRFDIRQHLKGPILSEGVIYGPTGRVAARFVADMAADWQGDTGTMTETFRYDSGTVQHRSWTLQVDDQGQITAEAPDLIGIGRGRQSGAGVCLSYRIRLPESSGGYVLDVTDWMYLMENGAIINRSQFRKFGVKVAELVATMRPASHAEQVKAVDECGIGLGSDTGLSEPPRVLAAP